MSISLSFVVYHSVSQRRCATRPGDSQAQLLGLPHGPGRLEEGALCVPVAGDAFGNVDPQLSIIRSREQVAAEEATAVVEGGDESRTAAEERVDDEVSWIREAQNEVAGQAAVERRGSAMWYA
jgi:hypothetical protein